MIRRFAPLVLLPLLIAAKPGSRKAPPPPPPPAPEEAAAEMIANTTIDAKVTLVDAGAEPRAVLAYHPRPGATAAVEMVVGLDLETAVSLPDGTTQAIPMSLPATVILLRSSVGQPVRNGLVPVHVEYGGLEARGGDPQLAQTMQSALAAMNGLAFDMFVDPVRGKPVQVDLTSADPSSPLADAMQQMMDQYVDKMVLFPDEPVGLGAKWTVDALIDMNGMQFATAQTLTARAITPTGVDVDAEFVMSPGPGGVTLPNLPPSAEVSITRFTGTGTGAYHVDLDRFVSTGQLVLDLDLAMAVNTGQGSAQMTMRMKENVDMKLVP